MQMTAIYFIYLLKFEIAWVRLQSTQTHLNLFSHTTHCASAMYADCRPLKSKAKWIHIRLCMWIGYTVQWTRNEKCRRNVIDGQISVEWVRTYGLWLMCFSGERPADECIFIPQHFYCNYIKYQLRPSTSWNEVTATIIPLTEMSSFCIKYYLSKS